MTTLLRLFLATALACGIAFSSSSGAAQKSSSSKTQDVRGYTRQDGTKVKAYKRAPAGTAAHSAAPATYSTAPESTPAPSTVAVPLRPMPTPRRTADGWPDGAGRKAACATCPRESLPRIKRSRAAINEFRRQHPCPATGNVAGPCSGYQIDHMKALEDGGADKSENMQWLSDGEHKAKHAKK